MIDRATVEKIKEAADIVEVVSDYVHLVRRGSNYMGLCPFHNERTPSFSVNKRRNFCYCFSCHKGGSPVNFIMEKEGVSYHDALLQLAAKYGIKVEERELTDQERASITRRESMLVANDWAMKKMQQMLRDTTEGRDVGLQYFYQRGITEEAIREFRLGYALDSGNELTSTARSAGLDIEVMRQLGLTGVSQQGREYDRFHGRIIFPILNSSGKPIAFGGRDLKGGPAKYINSPESDIYVKSNELYGIYQAKSEIVKQNRCYLVEGYMDVIGMWQSGLKNVVASSGTALTDGQIALIHRFTDNVTLIYDGDAAGIKAALRGVDMLLSHKMQVKVLLLPDGKDPDEFARDHTPEEFRKYVEDNQTDIIRFKINVLLADAKDDPQRKTQAILSVVNSIAAIPVDVERNFYVQECARLFGIDENSVGAAVGRALAERREKMHKERRLKDFDRQAVSTLSAKQLSSSNMQADNQDANVQSQNKPIGQQFRFGNTNPFEPFERKIIENCIRYGFVDIDVPCEDGSFEKLSVAQYVEEELEADSISFSVALYAEIFRQFPILRENFENRRRNYLSEIDKDLDEQRREEFMKLADQGLSMVTLQREEKKIEEKYSKIRAEEDENFCQEYCGIELASHEDNEIRRMVNNIINDRYQLSKIYRDTPREELEEGLFQRVYKSLAELRAEILNQEVKKLHSELADPATQSNAERLKEIMHRLTVLLKMRSTTALDIGDRIIAPR
ncbi:MAG: DNA primase [Clostridium sp.]|nr:DNA primase [Prevotella sp.]MCM1429303.1 DNA primase [Clostridium sp.]MCM1475664.1 DNA primase [Muribaculaceae bacterium]